MQYIGRLMREENDIPALREALAAHAAGQAENARAVRRAEALRDALLQADDQEAARLIDSFFSACPEPDPGQPDRTAPTQADRARAIMDLVRQARNEREHGRPPHAFRALFRRLRDLSAC